MKLFYSLYVYCLKSFQNLNVLIIFFVFIFISPPSSPIEIFDLSNNSTIIGDLKTIYVQEDETVADIANRYNSGFQDLLIANPNSHHWKPKANSKYIIPSMYILPQENYSGIILNLAELRLYYYIDGADLYETSKVLTYPVGIGRLDWKTPLGETFIKSKVVKPSWYPPKSIIKEHNLDRIDFIKTDCEGGEYSLFTEANMPFLLNNVRSIVGEFHLSHIYPEYKVEFRYFRDKYLKQFPNYEVYSIDGVNIKWDLWNDHFIEYYDQVIVHINNGI